MHDPLISWRLLAGDDHGPSSSYTAATAAGGGGAGTGSGTGGAGGGNTVQHSLLETGGRPTSGGQGNGNGGDGGGPTAAGEGGMMGAGGTASLDDEYGAAASSMYVLPVDKDKQVWISNSFLSPFRLPSCRKPHQ